MDSHPREPLGPDLPDALCNLLAETLFRVGDAASVAAHVDSLVAQWPEHEARIREWHSQFAGGVIEGSLVGAQLGQWRIEAMIGRGGFGEVYRASHAQFEGREAAVKALKPGMESESMLRRFVRERAALARMNHDAIAKIYEAGNTSTGRPWFAMELVDGEPIDRFCAGHHISLRQRLELMVKACLGAHHAHQKGVIHRDLKPSNLLVSGNSDAAFPKIIDFGIAADVEAEEGRTELTLAGQAVGTPAYMAPEQLVESSEGVDTRADVYALGAILYELLTGRAARAGALARARNAKDRREAVLDTVAKKPSLEPARDDDMTSPWRRQLRGELDWITQKATAPEPSLRYASAAELAADLERHLLNQPVIAGPPTARYQLAKLLRRYRIQAAAIAAVVITAILGGVVAFYFAVLAEERADENELLAQQKSSLARQEAEAREEAQSKAALAERLAQSESEAKQRAQELAGIAAAKVREFGLLKGVVQEQRARQAALGFYPAWPESLPSIEGWIANDASQLLSLRPEVQSAVQSLRASVSFPTEAERIAIRKAHPSWPEFELLDKQWDSTQRIQRIRRGEQDVVIPELPEKARSLEVIGFKANAWARVAPTRKGRAVFGQEDLGLALARAGVAKAAGTVNEVVMLDTRAWAEFENGMFEDAQQTVARMLRMAPPKRRLGYAARARDVLTAIESFDADLADIERRHALMLSVLERDERPKFPPERSADSFLHDTLVQLDSSIGEFEQGAMKWIAMQKRWVEALRDGLCRNNPNAACSWDDVRAAIAKADGILASKLYEGIQVDLSEGATHDLVPIGKNPATGLFEFYHLRSAWDGSSDPWSIPIPRHEGPDGNLVVGEATGIVFVLLPGGTCMIGSQDSDPSAPYYVSTKSPVEPLTQVSIEPFYLARHELTQGQWARLSNWSGAERLPSRVMLKGHESTRSSPLAHPVENVDQRMCAELATRHGLRLPNNAEWEYGCRAGTNTPWFCNGGELQAFANLADAMALRFNVVRDAEDWSDGFPVHARVGALRANAFGLHDAHGNVEEWVSDRGGPGMEFGYLRGGDYASNPNSCRSAMKDSRLCWFREITIGMRAARSLRPGTR